MKNILFFLSLLFFWACQKKSETTSKDSTTPIISNEKISKTKFEKFLPETAEKLKNFTDLTVLQKNLDSLNQEGLAESIARLDIVYDQAQDFHRVLPPEINQPAISARFKVLITEIGLLRQESKATYYSIQKLNEGKNKIGIAQRNLVAQINERFLEIPENIAAELLKKSTAKQDNTSSQ